MEIQIQTQVPEILSVWTKYILLLGCCICLMRCSPILWDRENTFQAVELCVSCLNRIRHWSTIAWPSLKGASPLLSSMCPVLKESFLPKKHWLTIASPSLQEVSWSLQSCPMENISRSSGQHSFSLTELDLFQRNVFLASNQFHSFTQFLGRFYLWGLDLMWSQTICNLSKFRSPVFSTSHPSGK